jgi:hypothetical protein
MILVYQNAIFIKNEEKCYTVTKGKRKVVVAGEENVLLYCGSKATIKDLNWGKTQKLGTSTIRLATLTEVKARFPRMSVLDKTKKGGPVAKPTLVTITTPGGKLERYGYRSMAAAMHALNISKSTLESVNAKHGRWKALKPPMVRDIKIMAPGAKFPRGTRVVGKTDPVPTILNIKKTKSGWEVTPSFKKLTFKSYMDIPHQIKELS